MSEYSSGNYVRPASEKTRRSPARFSHPANGKNTHSLQSSTMAGAGWRFVHSSGDLTAQFIISDYLTAMLDGNQEAPPRDTNAGSAHRITSLSLFFFFKLQYLPLWRRRPALTRLSSIFLFLLYEFPCFLPAALVFFNIPPSSVFPPLHLSVSVFREDMYTACAASLGVCFHISAQEKCRFCSKVTELSCRFLQFLSSYSVCVSVF